MFALEGGVGSGEWGSRVVSRVVMKEWFCAGCFVTYSRYLADSSLLLFALCFVWCTRSGEVGSLKLSFLARFKELDWTDNR